MSVSWGALGWRLAWKWCTLMVQTNLIVGREYRHALMPFVVPVTISPPSSISGTNFQGSLHCHQEAFTCQTSGLVYGISCRRCPAICIGETGRTPRQCLDEHLRSIKKNLPGFPIAEHFNAAGHSIDVVLVRGSFCSAVRPPAEAAGDVPDFKLGTIYPRCLNSDFHFLQAPAHCTLYILN